MKIPHDYVRDFLLYKEINGFLGRATLTLAVLCEYALAVAAGLMCEALLRYDSVLGMIASIMVLGWVAYAAVGPDYY